MFLPRDVLIFLSVVLYCLTVSSVVFPVSACSDCGEPWVHRGAGLLPPPMLLGPHSCHVIPALG